MDWLTNWAHGLYDGLNRHGWFRVVARAGLRVNDCDGPRVSAAMTYFALFSLFPFILLLVSLLSLAIDSRQAQTQVVSLLGALLPSGSSGAAQMIRDVISARGSVAGFSLIGLLWAAISWFEAIDRSVNEVWGVRQSRSFVKGKLFALAMISGIALVMILSWTMNLSIGIIRRFADTLFVSVLPGYSLAWSLVPAGLSFSLMALMFLLLYRFSPMCDLAWSEVWPGALIAALVWELVRSGFAIYVAYFANYSSTYGPLGAVMAFLFWLYLAHMIMLFGAALTYSMRLEKRSLSTQPSCAPPEDASTKQKPVA